MAAPSRTATRSIWRSAIVASAWNSTSLVCCATSGRLASGPTGASSASPPRVSASSRSVRVTTPGSACRGSSTSRQSTRASRSRALAAAIVVVAATRTAGASSAAPTWVTINSASSESRPRRASWPFTANPSWNHAANAGQSSSSSRNSPAGIRKLTTSVSAR